MRIEPKSETYAEQFIEGEPLPFLDMEIQILDEIYRIEDLFKEENGKHTLDDVELKDRDWVILSQGRFLVAFSNTEFHERYQPYASDETR